MAPSAPKRGASGPSGKERLRASEATERRAAAERLLAAADEVARRVVARLYEERPDEMARWGERGRRFCTEDSRYHVQYLAAAVEFDAPLTFTSYLLWARDILAARGIHPDHLMANVRALRGVLEAGDAEGLVSRHARPYLEAGEKALALAPPPSAGPRARRA